MNPTKSKTLIYSVLMFFISATVFAQENWPEFRGPTADGIVTTMSIPDKINSDVVKWETDIHGKGWSSPVIWGKQVWLTTAREDGKTMSAICVDIDSGKIVRDLVIHENAEPDFCHSTNSYASSTPAIEEGKIYTHFGKYGTTCIDTATFETVWQRTDFECDHFRGPAASPIIYKDLLIVAFDGVDQQYVVGMNKTTGKTVWKTKREIDYGTDVGDRMKAYGTGAIFEVDGEPLLIYPSAVATVAYRPLTGKPVWTIYHGGMNASARPVRAKDGNVILSNGMGSILSINPSGKGDLTDSNINWSMTKGTPRKSSQIVIDDEIYMTADKGIFSCVDLKTGQPKWQERVGGAFAASPIFDGQRLLALSEKGEAYVFKRNGTKYEEVSKSKFADGFKASPAVSGDNLILRSFSKLHCISNK